MQKRTLGQGRTVSAISLGCMGMTHRDDPFANEELVRGSLEATRDRVVIATKSGRRIDEAASEIEIEIEGDRYPPVLAARTGP